MAPRVLPGQLRQARVALLSTWHPEPVDNGRKQRTRLIIDALAEEHEVILISLLDSADLAGGELPAVPGVAAQFQLPLPTFRSRSAAGVGGAFSRLPRSLVATWDPATSRQVNAILSAHQVTAAIGTDLRTLRYLTNLPGGVARILDEPDVSPFVHHSGGLRAQLRRFKYRGFLRKAHRELDAVVVASGPEERAYAGLSGGSSSIIANVVPQLPESQWSPTDDRTLLFTGAMTYRPNLEAVEFFAERILKAAEPEHPGLQLIVTGQIPDPPPRISDHPLVTLTGRLDSLERLYVESRLFVVPLMSGTGTRIKALEAMSYGMPIVSTRKGVEGLPVVDGEHLLLADSVDEFTAAMLLLLDDRELCERLGRQARRLVAEHFTAAATARLWRDLIPQAIVQQQERSNHA